MPYENGQWVEDDDPFKDEDPSTLASQPSTSAPTTTAASVPNFDPRSQDTFDYGNGVTGRKLADGRWQYDAIRADPFQDFLGSQEVEQQLKIAKARNSGAATAADDAGALWQMANPGAVRQGSVTPFTNSQPSFDDPASRLVEDSALARYRHLQNPDANSGTALYEQYARKLFDMLQQPVYSQQDESIIKGRAIDSIMTEKDQTKQRWLEEMSRRGIPPSSGPALEGLRRIEEHYGGLLTTVQSQFAQNAIDQTRQQRFQALDTAGKLQGSEEGRLREANTYAGVPLDLQNQAFQRNLQMVGAGGSPQAMLQSLMQMLQFDQNASQLKSQNNQALTSGLLQYLGFLFG